MADHERVYQEQARQYHALISREDYCNHISQALTEITSFEDTDMVDIGAGTGRLTGMFSSIVKSVAAFDGSQAMLDVIQANINPEDRNKLKTSVSDLRIIPLEDASVDVVTAGWTISYIANSTVENWRENLFCTIKEMKRVVRAGGTIIILETLGTGTESPTRHDMLAGYYEELELRYGFAHTWIRTDYKFESVDVAEQLTRFFFGDELGDEVRERRSVVVPECTGIWWLHI